MAKYKSSPEKIKKQHKALGFYLMHMAWINGWDCVIVNREELLEFLGITRMKWRRIDWLRKDLKEFFPHFQDLSRDPGETFASLFLSRHPFPLRNWAAMHNGERIKLFEERGLKSGVVEIREKSKVLNTYESLSELDD